VHRAQCTGRRESKGKESAQGTVRRGQEKQGKERAQEKLKDVRGLFRAWQAKELETDLSISDNFSNFLNFSNSIISSYI
jgi:hypothetical protein